MGQQRSGVRGDGSTTTAAGATRATARMPAPARQPATEHGRRTRERLLAAAEAVFGDLGYDRASVTAITQNAGVAQGTFYVHFDSKHAIFVELVADFRRRLIAALGAATRRLEPGLPRAQVERTGLEACFAFALEHPALYRVVREAQFVAPETFRAYYESFAETYARGFRRDHPHLVERIDPDVAAWVSAAIADWFGLRWVVWQQRLPPAEVLDQLARLLDEGFGG